MFIQTAFEAFEAKGRGLFWMLYVELYTTSIDVQLGVIDLWRPKNIQNSRYFRDAKNWARAIAAFHTQGTGN